MGKLKKISYVLTITLLSAAILVILLFCFLLIQYFYSTSGTGFGTVADWIIAVANVIMATAAGYAGWNAKGWFSSKINEKKFTHADNVINQLNNLLYKSKELNELFLLLNHKLNTRQNSLAYVISISSFKEEENLIEEINQKLLLYKSELDRIDVQISNFRLWELETNEPRVFKKITDSHADFYWGLVNAIDSFRNTFKITSSNTFLLTSTHLNTFKIPKDKVRSIQDFFIELCNSHLEIEMPFRLLFKS